MSLIIQYCDRCGERVPAEAFDSGEALRYRNESYCPDCKAELLPQLMQDPDFREAVEKKNQPAAPQRKASLLKTPPGGTSARIPSSQTVRRNGASTRSRARSSGPHPRASGGHPRAHSGAHPRPGGGMPVWAIVGGIAAVVVVIAFLMMGSGDDRPPDQGGGGGTVELGKVPAHRPDPTPTGTSGPKPTPAEQRVIDAMAALEVFTRDNAERYLTRLQRTEDLRDQAVGTLYEKRLRELVGTARSALDGAAQRMFTTTKQIADAKVAEGDFELALKKWGEFSPELLSTEWERRVEAERERIRTTQRTTVAARDKIPDGIRRVTLFDGQSMKGWLVRGGQWNGAGGVITGINRGDTPSAMALGFSRAPDGRHQLLGDFYLGFEFRIQTGKLTVVARLPASGQRGRPIVAAFDPTQTTLRTREWYRAHILVRGMTAEYWVDGVLRKTSQTSVEQGPLGFQAGAGDQFQIRNLDLRLLSEGAALNNPPKADPGTGAPIQTGDDLGPFKRLLSTKSGLKVWKGVGHEGFTLDADGVLKAVAGPSADARMYRGNTSWTDYQITFEVRRVTKWMGIQLRFSEGKFAGLKLEGKQFKTPDTWTRFIFQVKGSELSYRVVGSKNTATQVVKVTNGVFGLHIPAGGSAEIKNLAYRLLTPPPPK